MPTLSIITAAHAPSAAYLPETIASVMQQSVPAGWKIEWIVQEDGVSPCLGKFFDGVELAKYEASGASLGIAATRNLALARASGDLVQVLDSDDVLLSGAAESLIALFVGSDIHWAVGQADDLMPDGNRVSWDSALPYGRVRAGVVNQWAESQGGNWPIHCAGLMLRSASLRAVGGWVGLPTDEDIAMFAALSEISDGYNLGEVTWLYRQHPQQTTRGSNTAHLSIQARRLALQRAKAVRLTGLRFGEGDGLAFGDTSHIVEVKAGTKEQPPV